MKQDITQFEKKILYFLLSHYNQQLGVGNHSKTETKRLSKAKNDITVKIANSMNAFMLLSEIIKLANITPDKISDSSMKYIREKYTDMNPDIIQSTLSLNLVGEEHVQQYFKTLQRDLAADVFNLDMMKKLFSAIFAFHPQGIIALDAGKHTAYKNDKDIGDAQYKNSHRKYYRDMASILVEYGIGEIKKNLHPKSDRTLIDNLDLTVNMIKRLDYHVDKVK